MDVGGYPEAELYHGDEIVDLPFGLRPDFLEVEFLLSGFENPLDFPSFKIAFHDFRIVPVREYADWRLVSGKRFHDEPAGLFKFLERDEIVSLREFPDFQGFPFEFRVSPKHRYEPRRFHPYREPEPFFHEEVEFLHVVIKPVSENPIPASESRADFPDLSREEVEPRRFSFVALFEHFPFEHYGNPVHAHGIEDVPVHGVSRASITDQGNAFHFFCRIFVQVNGIHTETGIRIQLPDELPEHFERFVRKGFERILPEVPGEILEDMLGVELSGFPEAGKYRSTVFEYRFEARAEEYLQALTIVCFSMSICIKKERKDIYTLIMPPLALSRENLGLLWEILGGF